MRVRVRACVGREITFHAAESVKHTASMWLARSSIEIGRGGLREHVGASAASRPPTSARTCRIGL